MNIHEDSLEALNSSSYEGVALSMNSVASGLQQEHWLRNGHPYRRLNLGGRWKGGYNRLRADLSQGRVLSSELAEYVSISVPVHTMDGWSFLGRAVHCLLRGDPYSSVHLAYYAELRAAISILASQGIGIFDKQHCIVDSAGSCTLVEPLAQDGVTMGSHRWAWEVFQWWAEQESSVELLREVIKPEGRPLGQWVDAMNKAQPGLQVIGADWLKLWGIDISRYFSDRDARNAASYWPTTIDSWDTRSAVENYRDVSDIWLTLEPDSEARFTELDRHLLRIVLVSGYIGATEEEDSGGSPNVELVLNQEGFKEEVEYLLMGMGMADSTKEYLRYFLTDSQLVELAVIRMANGKSRVGTSNHVAEVMSRATMLLRLATGAAALLLSDAGIERSDLEFWVDAIGTERGIWSPQRPPGQLIELWEPIDAILEGIDSETGGTDPSHHELWDKRPKEFTVLGECERVALWGLGL